MRLAVVSPPDEHAGEHAIVEALFAAGLDAYHVRKPGWPAARLATWLAALPACHHRRIHLHSHHGLAARFAVGVHLRDDGPEPATDARAGCARGRSCHDPATLRARLGRYDTLFFGPAFASLSKPGYGPVTPRALAEVRAILADPGRPPGTVVFAIGGVTPARLADCAALGFDGVALLGALWQAPDALAAFARFVPSSASLHPAKEIPA